MTEYAPPVLRAPSPASSVGTGYGPDQTAFSDTEDQLSKVAFERKCLDVLGLGVPSRQETEADADPLLIVPKNPSEEKALHDRVMQSLRSRVHQLEENELFEQTLLRGSQAALDQQPVSNDISTLMRDMMSTTLHNASANNTNITNGPWNSAGNRHYPVNDAKIETVDATQESATTAGRTASGIKGKGRNQKGL